MLIIGKTGCGVYGNFLYYFLNFSVNFNLFWKIKSIKKKKETIIITARSESDLTKSGCMKEFNKAFTKKDITHFSYTLGKNMGPVIQVHSIRSVV